MSYYPYWARPSTPSPEEFQRQWERNASKHRNKTGHAVLANTHGWACLEVGCGESKGRPEEGTLLAGAAR